MTLLVASPGLLTSVQDRGRTGFAAIGISPAGAFDSGAYALANRLVGNRAGAAALENLGGGLRLRAGRMLEVAVTGAAGPVLVAGAAAPRRALLRLRPGAELFVDTPVAGLRSYVAVRGGIAVPPVLGSASWDSLGGIGPRPLEPDDMLPVGPAPSQPPLVETAPHRTAEFRAGGPVVLRILPGPRDDWFRIDSWDLLGSGDYHVSQHSDRIGVRLSGPPVRRAPGFAGRELASEPMVRGAVEIPPDGQPIILGPDHPTTGGYPVIGVVHPADLDACAQLVPGTGVILRPMH